MSAPIVDSKNNATCNCCCSPYTTKLRSVVECACEFAVCKKCYVHWMGDAKHKLRCMSCNIEHDTEFILLNTYTTFRKTLRAVRVQLALDIEMQWMAETSKEMRIKSRKEFLEAKLDTLIISGLTEDDTAVMEMRQRISNVAAEDFVSCVKCDDGVMCKGDPDAEAHQGDYICSSCEAVACKDCRMDKTGAGTCSEAAYEQAHQCDPQVLEDLEYLNRTTKACPRCSVRCIKAEGCSQVECNECKHVFDYNTLQSEDHLNNHTRDSAYGTYDYIEQQVQGFKQADQTRFKYMSELWFETFENPYYRVVRKGNASIQTAVAVGSNLFRSIKERRSTSLDFKRVNYEWRVAYLSKQVTLEEFGDKAYKGHLVYKTCCEQTLVLAQAYVDISRQVHKYLDALHVDQPSLAEGVKFVSLYRNEEKMFEKRLKGVVVKAFQSIDEAGMASSNLRGRSI